MAQLLPMAAVSPVAELPPGLLAIRRGARVLLLNFCEAKRSVVIGGQTVAVKPRDLRKVTA